MTIFDLPTLDPAEALRLVNATLDAHPVLRRIYDEAFIAERIRRRGAYDLLLLYLVRSEDEMSIEYWNGVADDLATLEAEGSFEAFRAKLRLHKESGMVSARTELFFGAWIKRQGLSITMEPPVGETRKCEFVAETIPETWWEIKSPLDLEEFQNRGKVLEDVQRGLRRINQPFIIHLRKCNPPIDRVAAAVKDIKQQLYAFHRDGGQPPKIFTADGLVVEAGAMTQRPNGYLGTTMSSVICGNENASHVVKRIIEAADQIPRTGGGIVVIDRTASDWIHHEDVFDACYGEQFLTYDYHANQVVNARYPGAFHDSTTTRISAVVSYTRKYLDNDGIMTILHNPSALVPLPNDFLAYEGVRHTRRVVDGQGFRFVTTPQEDDEEDSG